MTFRTGNTKRRDYPSVLSDRSNLVVPYYEPCGLSFFHLIAVIDALHAGSQMIDHRLGRFEIYLGALGVAARGPTEIVRCEALDLFPRNDSHARKHAIPDFTPARIIARPVGPRRRKNPILVAL